MLCGSLGHSPGGHSCGLLCCDTTNTAAISSLCMCEDFSRLDTEQWDHGPVDRVLFTVQTRTLLKDINNYTGTTGISWNYPGQTRMDGLPSQEACFVVF